MSPPNDVIVTDRPDFTEASWTVGMGVLQIEAGYAYIYDSDEGTSTVLHSGGEPLFRYGILDDWLEFRIAFFPVQERENSAGTSNTTAGAEDIYVGFKIGLTPQAGLLPEMAIMPQALVPSGSFVWTRRLPSRGQLAVQLGDQRLVVAGRELAVQPGHR